MAGQQAVDQHEGHPAAGEAQCGKPDRQPAHAFGHQHQGDRGEQGPGAEGQHRMAQLGFQPAWVDVFAGGDQAAERHGQAGQQGQT
ncbi:hypothetical protein D3C77_654420 [compost metagenome]